MSCFPELPQSFYQTYAKYLRHIDPTHYSTLGGTPAALEAALHAQSTTLSGLFSRNQWGYAQGRYHHNLPYLAPDGGVSTSPTGRELGEMLWSDAVAALRLHLLAQLQAAGRLPAGPILDFEGANHLSNKNFFIRNPLAALQMILRNPHFGLIHTLGEEATIADVEKFFENPDWVEVLWKLGELPLHRVKPDSIVRRLIAKIGISLPRHDLLPESINFWEEMGVSREQLTEMLTQAQSRGSRGDLTRVLAAK